MARLNCPKDCEVCEDIEKNYFNDQVRAFFDFFRWRELCFFLVVVLIFSMTYGVLGCIIAIGILFLSSALGGGAVGDAFRDYPKQEPIIKYKSGCSKGPCKFCAIMQ